ncbi:MAG: 1,2-phenylacetyl-CoA epoxidase subunit PaaC [Casimicrobiaceae bacterium]
MADFDRVSREDLLCLADTCLLLGHRLSEWCGHGPILEEDIALSNCALDLLGQCRRLYQCVAARDGDDQTEDRLAYLRDPDDFRNVPLAALPNGDYAQTMLRAWVLGLWFSVVWDRLSSSADQELAAIARDAVKEARGLARHAGEWVVRFGDGTEESRARLLAAQTLLRHWVADLEGIDVAGVSGADVYRELMRASENVCARAELPEVFSGGGSLALDPVEARRELLAEMQALPRQYPDAVW